MPLVTTEAPLVSFIIVNYKMVNFLRHLFKGIQDAPPKFTYEFFLVDNDSRDGIEEVIREQFSWVNLIMSPKNVGLGAGVNLALPGARGKYVMWLNPDLVIEPGELDTWVEWMEAHPDVGVSGPRLMNADGTDQESCYQFPNPLIPILRRTPLGKLPGLSGIVSRYRMEGLDRTKEHDVDWVLGAAHLTRRETLEKIGRFDERFFLYFEDADVCRRVWLAGQRVVYTPVARILHYYQKQSQTKTLWQAFKNPITRIHIASGFKYFAKYFGQSNPRLEYQKKTASS